MAKSDRYHTKHCNSHRGGQYPCDCGNPRKPPSAPTAPSTAQSAELKPCPFCGSPAELEHDSDHHGEWFNLGCSRHWGREPDGKHCPGGRIWYTEDPDNESAAIAAWNTRTQEAQQAAVNDTVLARVETILNEESAWIARPNKEVSRRIALAATIAAVAVLDGQSSEGDTRQFACKARSANTGPYDPQECDWPFCGCDPYADKVLAAVDESRRCALLRKGEADA